MTDHFIDGLFDRPRHSVGRILFPVSRLLFDPERFPDADLESMSKKGMGGVYTHTSDGLRLRGETYTPTKCELIEEFYHPHHNALNQAAGAAIAKYGSCLIVDCHSFPASPLPYEEN